MDFFEGKKITLMGLGLLGRGVGDARFLREHGAELIVTDLKTEEELASSLEALKEYPNITFHLGGHRLEDFRGRDLIIRAANVPLNSSYLREARKHGTRITQSVTLFAELFQGTTIGITGTKGKTTVTQLVYYMLTRALLPQRSRDGLSLPVGLYLGQAATHAHRTPKIFLGGNAQGVSTLAFLDKAQQGDIAVLELDSWQLNSFGDAHISPRIAVFTNLFPDHMNYYQGDFDQYFEDKASIFKFQKDGDVLIAGSQVKEHILARYPETAGRIQTPTKKTVPSTWKHQLLGKHNTENIAFAVLAARALGVEEHYIQEAVENFEGVSGRLELVREKRGVKYYNDTTATTPSAVVAALDALSKGKNVVLIAGGSDKHVPDEALEELSRTIAQTCKAVMLLSGTGTGRLEPFLEGVAVSTHNSLESAVAQAASIAQAGDVVLLSPGFASFGMFTNEYDRGEQFVELVNTLA